MQEELKQRILGLLNNKESVSVEFKSAKNGFPKSFWSTYSAFANTEGGIIVLGVKESDNSFSLNGLTKNEVEKLVKDFWNAVNDKNQISVCLVKDSDILVLDIDGSYILKCEIPQASRDLKPVYCGRNAMSGTYRRNNEGDYHCDTYEVRRMYADANGNNSADGRILENYTWDDIDEPSWLQYRRVFSQLKPNHPWVKLDDASLMMKLGGYRKDRRSGIEGFTLAGILMFGKNLSIKDEECAPFFFPDYQEIPSDDGSIRWVDRIYPDGLWEANLFQYYTMVMPKLLQVIPKPFAIKGVQRVEEQSGHVAIREAFANLCVHADYSENTSLLIKKYPNKIVFSNPGVLLISKKQYYEGGVSCCRNTNLQQMFLMIGAVEKAGSGVDKILSGWDELNWKQPYIDESYNPNIVTLVMPMESLFDDNIVQKMRKCWGEKVDNLSKNEYRVAFMVMTKGIVSNKELQDVLHLHSYEVSNLLKGLCNKNILYTEGHGRGMKYKVKDGLMDIKQDVQINCVKEKGIPRRMNFDQIRKLIIDYCEDWRSIQDISNYLNRNKQYLRGEVLSKMDDVLEMKFPNSKNDPRQMYRVKRVQNQ